MSGKSKNRIIWGLKSWTTRELMVTIVLGLTLAVITIPLRLATSSLSAVFGPIASVPASAYVVLGGIFVGYIIRRPGSIALSQFVIGLVLMIFMPGGLFLVILYLIHAIAIELPFVVTRYRFYNALFLALAGGVARLLILASAWSAAGLSNVSPLIQVGIIAGGFLGGAIGGLVAMALAKAVQKAGILPDDEFENDKLVI